MEDKDKQWIQRHIGNRPYGNGHHAYSWKPLCGNIWVHTAGKHGKDISGQINLKIGFGVNQIFRTSSKKVKDRSNPYFSYHHKDYRRDNEENKGGVLYIPGHIFFPCTGRHGKQRCAAHAEHIGKPGNQYDEWKTYPHTAQCHCPGNRNTSNIKSIHHVIQDNKNLRNH